MARLSYIYVRISIFISIMNRRSPLLSDNSSSRLTSRPRRDPRRKTLTPSYALGKCNVPTDRAELACDLSLLCLSEKRNKISSPGDGRKRGDHIHHSRALTGQFLFSQKNQTVGPRPRRAARYVRICISGKDRQETTGVRAAAAASGTATAHDAKLC